MRTWFITGVSGRATADGHSLRRDAHAPPGLHKLDVNELDMSPARALA